VTHLSFILLSLGLLSSCMNRSGSLGKQQLNWSSSNLRGISPIAILEEFAGRSKVFNSPDSYGNYLFATGSGDYGFGIYNLDSGDFLSGRNVLTSSSSMKGKNFLDSDPASITAIARAGNYLFISGSEGLTQVDIGNKSNPFIYGHLPERVQTDVPLSKYQWNAIAVDRNGPGILGFTGNRMYALASGSQVPFERPLNRDLGCGRGAAEFQGATFLAGCSGLFRLNGVNAQGQTDLADDFPYLINAQQVFSTEQNLYVYHAPVNGRGSVAARSGIYVFDVMLNQVNFIPVTPVKSAHTFSVSPDDQYLFTNDADQDIAVYRIRWTNTGW